MNATRFDWSLIRSFLAALDHGSLTAAARALRMHQPTVGRHIAELEAQLGLVLFERTGRGLLPTPHATALAQPARAMAAAADRLALEATGERTETHGTVRLTASQPVACRLLPPILASMRLLLPDIQVELVSTNDVTNLLEREADIAIRMVRPEQSSLVAKRLGEVGVGAYAHPDYLARHGTPRTPADLLRHDLIDFDRVEDIRRGFVAMGGPPLPRERLVLRTDDLLAYEAAVRAAIGIGFLSHYVARGDPTLVPVLPMLTIPSLPVWLVAHREIRSSPRIRAVWDHLAGTLPALLD